MTRYKFFFGDIEGNEFEATIASSQYTGGQETIEGFCSIDYDLSENIFQPLQIKTCNISLTATSTNDLSDIWNEVDRYWNFQLKKNGVNFFTGYISTEDMEQSYTGENWTLNFDALGPLSFLESFGYYDESGLPYSGDETLMGIIVKCINKGFNETSHRIPIKAFHYLSVATNDLYLNAYLDQDQFYNEDGEAEDCRQILNDILKSLGCIIFQYEFSWYIIPVTAFRDLINTSFTLNTYTSQGVFNGTEVKSPLSTQRVGSEIKNVSIHHASLNQSFVIKRLYNNFRIKHNFDYSPQILPNGELIGLGATMPDWTLVGAETTVNGDTLEIDGKELVSEETLAATSSSVSLKENDVLEVDILAEYVDDPTEQHFKILLTNTTSGNDWTYRFQQRLEDSDDFNFGLWSQLPLGGSVHDSVEFKPGEGEVNHKLELQALPEDGDLYVEVYTGVFGAAHTGSSQTILKHFKIKAKEQAIEAEQFTYTRSDTTNGQIPEVYDVRFNTVDRNILRNIFKDSSGDALTGFYKSATITDRQMVDEIAEYVMNCFGENQKVLTGDVYGASEDFTPKRIDFLGSPFIPVRYSKDLSRNLASWQVWEVFISSASYTKETERIYRDAVKPVIK